MNSSWTAGSWFDPVRKVLVFNREVVGKLPAIRKAKMEEFRWLVGERSAMNDE